MFSENEDLLILFRCDNEIKKFLTRIEFKIDNSVNYLFGFVKEEQDKTYYEFEIIPKTQH